MNMAIVVFNKIGETLETKTGTKVLTSFMVKEEGTFRPLRNGEKATISLDSAKSFAAQGLCEIIETFETKA